MPIPRCPFEATPEQVEAHIDHYIDSFIDSLQSFFLVMPKGSAFVGFSRFQQAYHTLTDRTANFDQFSENLVLAAVEQDPFVLVILRTILGFTPPELAYMATMITQVDVSQSAVRTLDKRLKEGRFVFARTSKRTQQRFRALVHTAVRLIREGAPPAIEGGIHRLDKADTREGLDGIKQLAETGVPYDMLLYERFLGRPFASHRDSLSEEVGNILEDAIREKLESGNIPYHKTGVAERFADMDQAPDFLVPNQSHPHLIVEAKLAEDDGTARDKVTRVQHLAELRDQRLRAGLSSFEVVACVDGRGFGIRREDVKKLLAATKGKLFTLQTIDLIIDFTSLKDFRGAG